MVIMPLELQHGEFCKNNFYFSPHSYKGNEKQQCDEKDLQYQRQKREDNFNIILNGTYGN